MPLLHSRGTSYLLAVAFMFGIAGNVSAATNPMTLKDLSQIVLGLKKEVDRLSKENKTLSKKLERIETLRYAEHTPSSAYQIDNSERLMKARLSEPVRVASLGTARVSDKTSTREIKASDLETRITALEKKSHSEIRPYVRYDLAFGKSVINSSNHSDGRPSFQDIFYPVSAGLGLQLSSAIRADLTFDLYQNDLNIPQSDRVSVRNLFVLGNVYYDFPVLANLAIGENMGSIKPYVGAGLGSSYFWGNGGSYIQNDRSLFSFEGNFYETLAGAAMVGVNIGLHEGFSADVGYRYAHLGYFQTRGDVNHNIRLQRHDFRMGLRYAF